MTGHVAPDAVRQPRASRPEGAAELLLIRHGESEPAELGAPFPLVDGHGDPALHPDGEAQAEAVARRLAGAGLAAIYVTPLRRTAQTAAPLAAATGLAPHVERDLREVFLGKWEGGHYRIRAARGDPAVARARERHEWAEIPGAETTAALHARVRRGLERIATAHPDARVAVVVHGGVIGAALSIATGARAFAFNGAANGSITTLYLRQGDYTVRGFNECAHLD